MPDRSEELPAGDVTFLFTEVEGSTRLLEEHPAEHGAAIGRHHDLLATAVAKEGEVVFETIGDAAYAAMRSANVPSRFDCPYQGETGAPLYVGTCAANTEAAAVVAALNASDCPSR